MREWEPITKEELISKIRLSEESLKDDLLILWNQIRIEPEKWFEAEYGIEGGGFWAVGVINGSVIWYNDIEEGFNISDYNSYGTINDYASEQDELNWCLIKLHNSLKEIKNA
mgnify:CR=1 FL=1